MTPSATPGPVRLVVTSGSSRAGSLNMRLAQLAVRQATAQGAQAALLDLRELNLPLYDAEIEAAGMPEGALALRKLFAESDALIVCSPEYNGFPTPLLINALDWASRPVPADGLPGGPEALRATVAGLMSASPGRLGGLRSLGVLRSFLHMNLNMLIVPEQHALAMAGEAFDAAGNLLDARQLEGLDKVVDSVLKTASALKLLARQRQ